MTPSKPRKAGCFSEFARPLGAPEPLETVGSFWSNSNLWKRSGARVMIFLVQIPNIGHFEVYEDIRRYMDVFGSI